MLNKYLTKEIWYKNYIKFERLTISMATLTILPLANSQAYIFHILTLFIHATAKLFIVAAASVKSYIAYNTMTTTIIHFIVNVYFPKNNTIWNSNIGTISVRDSQLGNTTLLYNNCPYGIRNFADFSKTT